MQNEACQDKHVATQVQEVDDVNRKTETLDLEAELKTDGKYTQKVMDDLDALLADLQSTTAHISYQNTTQTPPTQQQQQQQEQNYRNPSLHRHERQVYSPVNFNPGTNGTGNNGGIDRNNHNTQGYLQNSQGPVYGYQQQPQYSAEYVQHAQRHQHLEGGTSQSHGQVTVKRVSYASSEDGGGRSESSTPPPLPPPPPSDVLDNLVLTSKQEDDTADGPVYQPQNFPPPTLRQTSSDRGQGRGERMSALSNNLSELDQLLQDLNSAQFMAEVDRKSSNINEATTIVNGKDSTSRSAVNHHSATSTVGAPAVAPKPLHGGAGQVPQRTSVDNLLDELEGANQPGRFPVEIEPHYQELNTVTTNHQNANSKVYPQQYHQHQLQHQQQNQQYHSQAQHLHPGSSNYITASSSSTSSSSSYHQPGQTASTATRELDDLMNSLSEFKLQTTDNQADHEPAYAKPIKSRTSSATSPVSPGMPTEHHHHHQQQQQQIQENGQLESMLGHLQSDMNRQGVNTKQKGVCAACQKPIVGQVIAALGKTWHVEHFVCAHCEEPLGTRNFYERDSVAYCETDYHHLFAPRCAYCNGPIVDKCIEALSKMWHPEHFFCAQCGRPFGEEDFHEKDGHAYCREDYFGMFAPKCGGCALPIMENYISALNRQWHPECFVCWDCRAMFGAGSFFDYEGLPYCETHYHAKKGSLCASCEKPITGRCITAMFKKFHPEHFVCAFCLKQLNKGTFKEQNDKPYCHPCFVKLFG